MYKQPIGYRFVKPHARELLINVFDMKSMITNYVTGNKKKTIYYYFQQNYRYKKQPRVFVWARARNAIQRKI